MKKKHLLSLMLIILLTIPMTGWAQALFDPNNIRLEPSRLFPILSSTDIIGAPDDALQLSTIKKIEDRCMSRVPDRFTPTAHRDYCSCSSATTYGTVTVGELRELQKDTNRKLGNATFEKYVKNVMKPCMEQVIEDVEYMFCITSQKNDWRIHLPIPYCKCSSRGIGEHFSKNGLEEMMISWADKNISEDQSPIDTIWENNTFLKSREAKKDECIARYMDPKYFR